MGRIKFQSRRNTQTSIEKDSHRRKQPVRQCYDNKKFTPFGGGDAFTESVCQIKESAEWVRRNAVFEEEPNELRLIDAFIDVYWDEGAMGWYTARVIGSGTEEGTLSIHYSDGEKDECFALSEWMWSVSDKSSAWLQDIENSLPVRTQQRVNRKRTRVLDSSESSDEDNDDDDDGDGEWETAEEEQQDNEQSSEESQQDTELMSEDTSDDGNDDGTPDYEKNGLPASSGVLSYEDALCYWSYGHDPRFHPLFADVGGMAFHVCNDRWRHAFHHIPNSEFAKELLRICTGPLLPNCKHRRKKCKLCMGGSCKRHNMCRGINAKCIMCNRQRTCIHVQLGSMLERWVPMGECCLRKLDSVILLYEALKKIRDIRELRIPETIEEQFQVVQQPVDSFNKAVNEFDLAMGMDQTYHRYGSAGAGFYKTDTFN